VTRQQAAALRSESSLARLLPASGACRAGHATGCSLTTTCLDEAATPEGCLLLLTTVEVSSSDGRTASATTVGYVPLEAAPVGVPTALEFLP
jgi:hypothetical protein